uniref:Uncharacterized protein TCIL3000_8_4520 n=1 Tax=Trypanosoma congolense (strain IL3000) TaxID=1068625 RepID=G0US69_TRYCI|nr:unnamed protein product [Trypanosoma congolense IL3000]
MYVYSIAQIREMQPLYREPPYPGFSLEEACRRKRQTQTKLVRGPNAWVARGSAKSTNEWVERLVRGSLNKLSAANFDEIVAKLQTDTIFSSQEALRMTVSIIFNKALEEPENSKFYAGVCYKLAEYEVSLNTSKWQADGKRRSELRNAVVGVAQTEFQNRRKVPTADGLAGEEAEKQRLSFMRRQLANMKFIGELFMHRVLSHNTMMDIINSILQEAENGGYPTSEDIEFIIELFHTIGKNLDNITALKPKLDDYFKLLEHLKDQKEVYPPRIRFKMLNLIELRRDRNWEERSSIVPNTSASIHKEPQRVADKGATRPPQTVNSGNAPGGVKKGKNVAPPDSAVNQQGGTACASRDAWGVATPQNWRDVVKSKASCSNSGPGVSEPVDFEARVRSLFQGWVSDCGNECIPNWTDEFRGCDRHFSSKSDLSRAVATQVVREACKTTKKDAQLDASKFIIIGIYLEDDEVFDAFSTALATAIEEGILEDVPKFSERFVRMLEIVSGDDVLTDVYYDTARVLCTTYGMLCDPDETVLNTLMGFWEKVPPPEAEQPPKFPLPVIESLVSMAKPQKTQLAGFIIASLHAMGLVDNDTIDEWFQMNGGEVEAGVKAAFESARSNTVASYS